MTGNAKEQAADRAIADLRSGDPERIARALGELRQRMNHTQAFDIEPFDAGILAGNLPESAQLDFVAIMHRYKRFVPPLEKAKRWAAMAHVVAQYGERYVAFEVALKVKISKAPVEAIEAVMAPLAVCVGASVHGHEGAAYLVSALLDGAPQVRRSTLQMLRQWPKEVAHQKVVAYVTPQLSPSELAFLHGV